MIRYLLLITGLMFMTGCSSFKFGAGKIETEAATVEDVEVEVTTEPDKK